MKNWAYSACKADMPFFVSRIRLLQAGVRDGLWGNMRIGELVGVDDLHIGCNNMLSFNYRF